MLMCGTGKRGRGFLLSCCLRSNELRCAADGLLMDGPSP